MLPTLVIGLREGLEAALIVGIVAAFLNKQGRSDLLRWAFVGIVAAVGLCVAAGVALELVSRDLPQRQQEGLETVIGTLAVGMVSYMVVWMRRHSRDLKGQLEGAAGAALAAGSGWALVAMAFLAVLREGLETAVFLLAAFNETGNGHAAAFGASLGIAIAVGLGYAIYRGGVRLNLSKFFRATGLVLVLVAAGLVVSALHTAHEAGWLNIGQQSTIDLSGFVRTGTVQSSVLTGMLGLQPRPVLIEVIGWLVYLVPMTLYVGWKPGAAPARNTVAKVAVAAGVVCLAVVVPLIAFRPAAPVQRPASAAGGLSAQVVSVNGRQAVIRATLPTSTAPTDPAALPAAVQAGPVAARQLTATRTGSEQRAGTRVDVYTISTDRTGETGRIDPSALAELNGGRLPIGIKASAGPGGGIPATIRSTEQETFWVARDSLRVVDLSWQQTVTVRAGSSVGTIPVKAGTTAVRFPADGTASALRAAQAADRATDRRHRFVVLAGLAFGAGAALLLVGAGFAAAGRREQHHLEPVADPQDTEPEMLTPAREPVRS
jgi:high-affinity iron transporter